AYGFDAGIQIFVPGQTEFNTLEQMGPCFGYWVKVSADGDLIYPGQGPVVASSRVDHQAEAAAKLVRSDVTPTTSWVNVYSANLTLDGAAVLPGADIAAYSTEGKKIGGFTVTESGKFGFMPVYADDANNSGVTGLKKGDQFYLTVNGAETTERYTWTTNGDRIEVGALTSKTASDNTLPTTYSLAQNYPNPFNPTTNISFTMPVTAKATITVYNVLGKVVAVPFDGMATAGENVVTWNGRDMNGDQVASGVYFYRLSTDKYTETRKMMLLK
ncbi:MAG: T9SS type A sorting domain-containing protein, partial [Candidatus Zixiibacteriota bacterium]